ncbi:MAG: aspartate 1-decarboxylase, partial [Patescibacteria group bacterium]|nr:aspartate 1-decarboxylase [Patescibacteria group bacterium]
YHFKKGDPVTIRGAALISYKDMPKMAEGHTEVYFTQSKGAPNQVVSVRTKRVEIPKKHLRKMCISKLHRIKITNVSPEGPEALVVDADILEKAGFPAGIEAQFTSLGDGSMRRTSVQAGPRGTGIAELHGSGAQYIPVGTRAISLAEVWLPLEDAVKLTTGPQVAFFDETDTSNRNIVREVKPGWRPA